MSDRIDQIINQGYAWYRTLHGTRWKPQDRDETVDLADLDPSHRRNLLAWMERRAPRIAELAGWGTCRILIPDSDGAWGTEVALEHEWDEMFAHPHRWLDQTPFMVELRRLIREDEARASRYRAQGHAEPDIWAAVPVE